MMPSRREPLRLVRLEVLTPTHLGSAAGEAALDRPTERESFFGLPFVPDSALKGNLAASWGDVDDLVVNEPREARFGSPDRGGEAGKPDRPGRPSPFSIGNGELISFPMPTREGRVAWVVPALSLARLLEREGLPADEAAAAGLVAIERFESPERFAAWPARPAVDALAGMEALDQPLSDDLAGSVGSRLDRYLGAGHETGSRIVVSSRTAGRLFHQAAELRSLTALGVGKVVSSGTLRRVELVPPGTVFVATLSGKAPDLPPRLQVGAWESLGCGWLALGAIEPRTATKTSFESGDLLDPAAEMADMHQAIERLAAEAPELAAKAGAAIDRFGPRAAFTGFASALAFALAKARPSDPEPSLEARAHRWLLGTLLDLAGGVPAVREVSQPLLDWLVRDRFSSFRLAQEKDRTLLRWRWLRRSAELGLANLAEGPPE